MADKPEVLTDEKARELAQRLTLSSRYEDHYGLELARYILSLERETVSPVVAEAESREFARQALHAEAGIEMLQAELAEIKGKREYRAVYEVAGDLDRYNSITHRNRQEIERYIAERPHLIRPEVQSRYQHGPWEAEKEGKE